MPALFIPATLASLVFGVLPVVCAVLVFCLPAYGIVLWVLTSAHRRRSDLEIAKLRHVVESNRTRCAEEIAGLSRTLETFGESRQTMDELLREGRLNQSCRARALGLLRTGITPDTAAETLGIAAREMRLLARVSRLLIPTPAEAALKKTSSSADVSVEVTRA